MKTWTNPTVEELEVKNTAALWAWWQIEEANGVIDDSLLWGEDAPQNPGTGEEEGGFGNES